MTITPNSTVVLVKNAPVDPSLNNFLLYENAGAQATSFLARQYKRFDNCTYVNKKDDGTETNEIRVEGSADDMVNAGVNLVMYRNSNFAQTPRWFYGYVTDISQVNAIVVSITFSPAWVLNYFYDIKFGDAFVERMHVARANDIPGKFLIPEGMETGPFVTNKQIQLFNKKGKQDAMAPHIVLRCNLSSTRDLEIKDGSGQTGYVLAGAVKTFAGGIPVSGVFQGCFYVASPPIMTWNDGKKTFDLNQEHINTFNTFCSNLVKNGQVEQIQSIYLAPHMIVKGCNIHVMTTEEAADPTLVPIEGYGHVNTSFTTFEDGGVQLPTDFTFTADDIGDKNTIDGYTPKNKKLLTGEYNFMSISNGLTTKEYFFEYFNRGKTSFRTPVFQYYGGLSESNAVMGIFPNGYKTDGVENDEALLLESYPVCSYAYSPVMNELAKHRNENFSNYLEARTYTPIKNMFGGLASIASASTPAMGSSAEVGQNVAGAALSAVPGIVTGLSDSFVSMGKAVDRANDYLRAPAISKGSANVGLRGMLNMLSLNRRAEGTIMPAGTDFIVKHTSITAEFAKVIDTFFERYGYKVNIQLKLNEAIKTRSAYNYIKVSDIAIQSYTGPEIAFLKVREMLIHGVTIWHGPSNWLNFGVKND